MCRTKRVVIAFRPLGNAAQAALLPQGPHLVPPPGDDLVRIALLADIPDQLVEGRVEDGMNRHRQPYHP